MVKQKPNPQWNVTHRIVRKNVGGRGLCAFLFFIWGVGGFFVSFFAMGSIWTSSEVGVGTSAYVTAGLLYCIAGMLFFGLAAILAEPDYYIERATAIKVEAKSPDYAESREPPAYGERDFQ